MLHASPKYKPCGSLHAKAGFILDKEFGRAFSKAEPAARETVEVSLKYRENLALQQRSIERVQRSANRVLPDDLDYTRVESLSNEEIEKLSAARPRTLQEASEISGVTPYALTAILSLLRAMDAEAARQKANEPGAIPHVSQKQRRKAMARAALASATAGEQGGGVPGG